MLWMMGYDYDRILQELYKFVDDSDSQDDESSANSKVSGYESKDSSYDIDQLNDEETI